MISKEDRQEALNEYCMSQLNEIITETVDLDLAAFRTALVISYAHDTIDELKLDFYLAQLDIDREFMLRRVRWFAGAGLLEVTCLGHSYGGDCLAASIHNENDVHYWHGQEAKLANSMDYTDTLEMIQGFRQTFWESDLG